MKQFIAACSLLCICVAKPSFAWSASISEEDMKSAYLYNFALFTEWPDSELPTFNICTLDKVADSLSSQLFENKLIHGKKVNLLQLDKPDHVKNCQILLLNSANPDYLAKVANVASSEPVLTISELDREPGFGIINLNIKNNRLVFDINIERARRANISLSSKLIVLARKVYD